MLPPTSWAAGVLARHRTTADVLLGAAVTAVSLLSLQVPPARLPYEVREPDLLAVSLAVLAGAAVAIRRRHGLLALVLATAAALLPVHLAYGAATAGLAPLLVLWTLAAHRPPRESVTGVLLLAAAAALLLRHGPWEATPTEWLGNALVLGAVFGLGRSAARRRAYADRLEERNRALLEACRARDAALEADERARIVGEMQDLVTHSLTAITVSAAAARRAVRSDPGAAEQLLTGLEQAGREAAEEMRSVLSVLSPDAPAQRAPQPGLDDLGELVAQARADGVQVQLVTDGVPVGVDPGVALTAYRVVEEALATAREQPHCCRVGIRLVWRDDRLDVAVEEDGRRAPAVVSQRLLGDRVRAYGGRLRTTVPDGGGVTVHASLPTRRSAR